MQGKRLALLALVVLLAVQLPAASQVPHPRQDRGSQPRVAESNLAPPGNSAASDGPSPSAGAVALTLEPFNQTVLPGLVRAGIPGSGDILYDPIVNQVFVGPGSNGGEVVLNGTTGKAEAIVYLPVGAPSAMVLDPSRDEVFVTGTPWRVVGFWASNDTPANTDMTVGHGPDAITYDPLDDRLFVACRYDSDIWILNASTGSEVGSPIPIYSPPFALAYDPQANEVLVSTAAKTVLALNASTDVWASAVNWTVGSGAYSMALDQKTNWVYVGNYYSDNVTVVNASDNVPVVGGVTLGSPATVYPSGLIYYGPTNSVLVATGAAVYSFGASNLTLTNSSAESPGVFGLAEDGATGVVYATAGGALGAYPSNYLLEFDARTTLKSVDLQLQFSLGDSVYDSSTGKVYVIDPTGLNGTGAPPNLNSTSGGNGSVLTINATTHRFVPGAIQVGFDPVSLAVADGGSRLFVADRFASAVTMVVLATSTPTTLPLGRGFLPSTIGVDWTRDRVYVGGDGRTNLTVLNGSTGAVVSSSVNVGNSSSSILFDPALDELFVANCGSNNVSIVDAGSMRAVGAGIPVGNCPSAMALDPANGVVVVANENSANVSFINTTSDRVEGTIPTGLLPDSAVFNPANGFVYVANGLSDNVTVLVPAFPTSPPETIDVLPPSSASNVAPLGLSFDPTTDEIYVPTSFGNSAFVIGAVPGPLNLTVRPSRPESGEPFALSASVSGGQPPFTYRFSGLPPGCGPPNGNLEFCVPSAAGTYPVRASATDARNYSVFASINLSIAPSLNSGALTIGPDPTEVGVTAVLGINPSGGIAPWSITYAGLPPGCATANSSELRCDPASPGIYLVTASVSDGQDVVSSSSGALVVGSVPVISDFVAGRNPVVSGTPLVLALSTDGGVSPVTLTYTGLPVGCDSENTTVLSCVPSEVGNFTVSATVTDAFGLSAESSLRLTITPPPKLPAPSITGFSSVPAVVTLGDSTTLVVSVAGAPPPFRYAYSALPAGCAPASSPILECTPSFVGVYNLTVTVSNGNGSANATTRLTVEPAGPGRPGSASAPFGGVPWYGLVVLATGSAGLSGLGVYAFGRRRRRNLTPASPPP